MYSRRDFLAVAGTGVVGAFAGCVGGSDGEYRPRDPGEHPDPTTHVRGSDGRWSSFGFDAANTRWDRDGRAPRDGIEERWAVDVGLPHAEPIARDGRAFVTDGDELLALDEESGAELWSVPARRGLTALVFEDVVYHVGDDATDGWALIAREAGTGEELWRAEVAATTGPAGGGRHLVVASGETLHSLDPETGDVRWQRRLFGRINDGIAMADLTFPCVTTRAGLVYQLRDDDGDGLLRHQLPAPVQGPPTVGTDRIFVGATDGRIHAIGFRGAGEGYRAWSAEVGGHAEGPIAFDGDAVYAVSAGSLVVLAADDGDERWSRSVGSARGVAPAVVGDTVYVGGDRLSAFERGGGAGVGRFRVGGERFSEPLGDGVGPGPVVSDGVVYTYAGTENGEYRLVAAEAA